MWEKLRHSLRDALRRQKKIVRSGAAATNFKPWKFQKEMGFLQPYMANRKRETNLNEESDEELTQNSDDLECEDSQEADIVVEPESENRDDEGEGEGTATIFPATSKESTLRKRTQESPSDPPGESTPRPQKQARKKDNVAVLLKKSIENREKRAAERAAERAVLLDKIQPSSDPLYHFFMSMYETTKKMPPSSQHVVKNHIYKAVADMEATLLNIPQTNSQQTSQFYDCNVQPQYDRYMDYQSSPSTSHSSYSENSSHQRFTTNIQNASSEGREERATLVNFINQFSTD